jgi:hypothetical protein
MLVLVGLVLLAAAGVAVSRLVRHYHDGVALAGRTDDPSLVRMTIAGTELAIPANMIRTARQRRGGAVERVDLLVDWPELEGYSAENAAAFRSTSAIAPLIYIWLVPSDSALDSSARLEKVYARFFTGETLRGPSGLAGRRLSEDSGYRDELVFFEARADEPFVARCLAKATPEIPATCLRDVLVAPNLSMHYRFDRFYLGDWQAMDAGLRVLAAGFLAGR